MALVVLDQKKVPAATKKILIVEDEGDWRELLTQVIGRSGYQVIEVDSGTQAIDQATAVHPDLILLDLGLPGMSADKIIGELKMNSSTKEIPVIVQTAYADDNCVHHAMEAGAKLVLYKPFDLSELPAILRKHLASQNDGVKSTARSTLLRDQSGPIKDSIRRS